MFCQPVSDGKRISILCHIKKKKKNMSVVKKTRLTASAVKVLSTSIFKLIWCIINSSVHIYIQ